MSVTNLNDRWSSIAAKATERTEPKTRVVVNLKPTSAPAANPIAPALETVKKFCRANVDAKDKTAPPAVMENGVRSQWMNVTPETASRWLKNNFRNRPVSDGVVAAYAADMAQGVWMPTHQGIAFNDRDELIDGQHRLMAVVKSRKTVRMMVTFGLKSKIEGSAMTTMDCVDRGRTRSVADQLKIQHGYKNGTQIAQVASALAGFCHESIRRPSVDATLKIYELFKVEMDYVIANRSKLPGLRSAGVLAGFVFALAAQPEAIAKRSVATMFVSLVWGDDVREGRKLAAYPAVQQLHAFLTGEKGSMLIASMNRGVADLTLQAIWMDLTKQTGALKMELHGREFFCGANVLKVQKVKALFELPASK